MTSVAASCGEIIEQAPDALMIAVSEMLTAGDVLPEATDVRDETTK